MKVRDPELDLASPRRRGRPQVILSERLLEIARDVFLERGIRATTAEVALRAGISEGTVFHRFGTKDGLFRAAMRFDPTVLPPVLAEAPRRAGHGDLRQTLVEVGLELVELGSVALPMMMMAWSNPASDFALEKMVGRSDGRYERGIEALREFFAIEQERGRISKDTPPGILARCFLGSLHHYCMTEIWNPGPRAGRPPRETFVRGIVDLLLDGAAGSARAKSARTVRRK